MCTEDDAMKFGNGVINGTHHCAKCGAVIGDGDHYNFDGGMFVCDDCFMAGGRTPGGDWVQLQECIECHRLMYQGNTDLWDVYVCDECFDGYVKHEGLKANYHEDEDNWGGGYWDYLDENGKWVDTGIFWTDWTE